MKVAFTVLIAVLAFGFMIFIHELGHFLTARAFKINVYEFSLGMGPRLAWYDSKKSGIRYKLCMLPIGGYVSFGKEGSDDSAPSEDPHDIVNQRPWVRLLVMIAGGVLNIILGFVLALIVSAASAVGTTEVAQFPPALESEGVGTAEMGLKVGDEIIKIDGVRVRTDLELDYEIMRRGIEPIDVVVLRDSNKDGVREEVTLSLTFPTETSSGQTVGTRDFSVYAAQKSIGSVLYHSFFRTTCMVKMAWQSLWDLISGRYSVEAVSGPVGITSSMGEVASYGLLPLLYMVSMISTNLGVVNLLPIPALDGGRSVFVIIEMITKKRVPPEIEAKIHGIGILLLLGLMVLVTVMDIRSFFG